MTASKIVAAAASGVNRDPGPDIDDTFSTQLYTGNNATRFITNNISLGDTYQFDHTFDGTQTTPTTISPGLGTINTWEVSFFLKCTDTSIGNQWVITTNQGYSNSSPAGFLIGLYNLPGYLSIAIAGTNFGAYGFTGNYQILQDKTYHVVVNYNGNGQCRVFVDGVAIGASNGTLSLGSGFVTWSTVDLGVGRSTQGGAYNTSRFVGSLHDVTVSSTVSKTSNFTAPTMGSSGATVDVAGSGGLVWTKSRSNGHNHALVDSENGVGKYLVTNSTSELRTDSYAQQALVEFLADGYKLGPDTGSDTMNRNGRTYFSWTFRQARKFFDVVKYSGTGSKRTVSHNLGSTPGMIIIKRTNANGDNWDVWHRSLGGSGTTNNYLQLNNANAASGTSRFGTYGTDDPTSTTFTVNTQSSVNASGGEYVAYLFAHNDGDGAFGENANEDVIKCGATGSYTSGTPLAVNVGFEPQWILIRRSDGSDGWYIVDNMRGAYTHEGPYIQPNNSSAESYFANYGVAVPTSTGFILDQGSSALLATGNYIYMAIRRGPIKVPTDVDKVFHLNYNTSTGYTEYTDVGFAPDMAMQKAVSSGDNWDVVDKLRGPSKYIKTNANSAEATDTQYMLGSFLNNGVTMGTSNSGQFNGWNPNLLHFWKRAPSHFDIVHYSGTGNNRTIGHSLGVVPEMIWVKSRSSSDSWQVYHAALGNAAYVQLNSTNAQVTGEANRWNSTTPTSSVFSIGTSGSVNGGSDTYIAYLFATAEGVSKVGTYEGNGSDGKQIDCGFSSGTRWVVIKNADVGSTYWTVFDATRGINGGNDSRLLLNANDSQATGSDYIDPYDAGFALSADAQVNNNGSTYIFYALAN